MAQLNLLLVSFLNLLHSRRCVIDEPTFNKSRAQIYEELISVLAEDIIVVNLFKCSCRPYALNVICFLIGP